MPLGFGHDEKTVSVESLNRPRGFAATKASGPCSFFSPFFWVPRRLIFVDVNCIVVGVSKLLANHFLTKATNTPTMKSYMIFRQLR